MSKYTQTPNRQPLQLHYFKMKVYDRAKYIMTGQRCLVTTETGLGTKSLTRICRNIGLLASV
jgi:hypothetical protein